mgnify:CR=1 FL=1
MPGQPPPATASPWIQSRQAGSRILATSATHPGCKPGPLQAQGTEPRPPLLSAHRRPPPARPSPRAVDVGEELPSGSRQQCRVGRCGETLHRCTARMQGGRRSTRRGRSFVAGDGEWGRVGSRRGDRGCNVWALARRLFFLKTQSMQLSCCDLRG